MSEDSEPKAGVTWVQVAGSALAAVSSAVLLSTLGVGGTLVGAAIGSVAATVGTALYTRTLDVSRQQVAAQTAALRRVARARSDLDHAMSASRRGEDPAATGITRAEAELDRAEAALATVPAVRDAVDMPDAAGGPPLTGVRPEGASPRDPRRAVLGALSWKRVATVAAAVFVVAMVTITAFELATGRAVSSYTGGSDRETGSTVPGLDARERPSERQPSDDVTGDEVGEPVEERTDDAPTATPTASETPTDDPTASTTPTPSASPTVTVPPTTLPSSTATGSAGG